MHTEDRDICNKLQRLAKHQRHLDNRLIAIEHGLLFRTLRALGGPLRKIISCISGISRGYSSVETDDIDRQYSLKLATMEAVGTILKDYRQRLNRISKRPQFTILMSVRGAHQEWLRAAVDSICHQYYDRWELFAFVAAEDERALSFLKTKAAEDSRVTIMRANGFDAFHLISSAINGDYVGILGQHDCLSPLTLSYFAQTLQNSEYDLIYSDEDQIDSRGRRKRPVFKPNWSPELLFNCMYLGRFVALSRKALTRIGWLRGEFGSMQEYDAVLRLSELCEPQVCHVPQVLYHRREEESDVRDHELARRVVIDAIVRRGTQADLEDGLAHCTFRLRRKLPSPPLVSVIVCSCQPSLLKRFMRKLHRHTTYPRWETVVVEHKIASNPTVISLSSEYSYIRVPYEGVYNFSLMNNLAVRSARGEVLLFMNDDVEPITVDWMDRMVAQAMRSEVGVVGAKVLYPSGRLQHAGDVVGVLDGAGHVGRNRVEVPHWPWLNMTREVSAVTGACIAVRREVFDQLAGFDIRFAWNYNDIDLCLRARCAGYSVIYESGAVLLHYEARTRQAVVRYEERDMFHERWGELLARGDPYYNLNLTCESDDASLRIECSEADFENFHVK